MERENLWQGSCRRVVWCTLAPLLLAAGCAVGPTGDSATKADRTVFELKAIAPERAAELLSDLAFDEVSILAESNGIAVSGPADVQQKAAVVLDLLDAPVPYTIETSLDYTAYDAGITLNITPHISEGHLLRLDISLIRSDFLPTEDQKKPPNTTASEVRTAVTVPDGSTIILGGLLKLNQNKGGKKVPLLGDVPVVGGLFRSTNNSDKQSKLYVFVKAEIIRPTDGPVQGTGALEAISQRNRDAFEMHEAKFQTYQDWPGLKPKPVEPARVLDAR